MPYVVGILIGLVGGVLGAWAIVSFLHGLEACCCSTNAQPAPRRGTRRGGRAPQRVGAGRQGGGSESPQRDRTRPRRRDGPRRSSASSESASPRAISTRQLEDVERRDQGLADRETHVQGATGGAQGREGRRAARARAHRRADLSKTPRRRCSRAPRSSSATSWPGACGNSTRRRQTEARRTARNLVADALQRVAASHAAETTVSIVELPSDDMKGRIIGREGRNIRALEHLTGVDFIVDDTPQAVVLSSFDGIRREVAKLTLQKLLEDGRIHPARVEEMYYQSKAEVDDLIRQAGEQAVFEANCGEFHEELVKILGRLQVPHELRPERPQAHARGRTAGRRHGERARRERQDREARGAAPRPRQGAYSRGGGRPRPHLRALRPSLRRDAGRRPRDRGTPLRRPTADRRGRARHRGRRRRPPPAREPAARASSRTSSDWRRSRSSPPRRAGVERVYALQAGREIRVIVKPEEIADDEAALMSHEIAREIEQHLEYPGQIKVTVIRESRAIEYAK